MKKNENEKYVNARSVIEFTNLHSERAEKVPAYVKFIRKLETQVTLLSAAESQATLNTKGATLEKNNTKTAVQDEVVRLSKILVAYANDVEDVVLEKKVGAMQSKLSKAKQAEFPTQCKDVLTEAKTLNGSLAEYGFTMEGLLALEAKVAIYDAKTPQTNHLKAQKNAGSKAKKQIFTKLDKITNKQIKNAAVAFIGVDDELYNGIMDCLKTNKRAASSPTQIKVVFKIEKSLKNFQTIQEIKDATVVGTKKVGKANDKGEMFFKVSKSGTYALNIPLPNGEIRFISDIEVKRGQTTEIEVAI